jgi:hypothetical protein
VSVIAVVFPGVSDFLSRCVDVSRPDRLSSAEITSVVQAAGLQGVNGALHSSTVDLSNFIAVRKNRYVILPIDFEEAWKVSNVIESIRTHVLIIIIIIINSFLPPPANGQEGRRDA